MFVRHDKNNKRLVEMSDVGDESATAKDRPIEDGDDDDENNGGGFYEHVDLLLDMEFDEEERNFSRPCPCGDKFLISVQDVLDNEDLGACASCSLLIRVKYDPTEVRERFGELEEDEDEGRGAVYGEQSTITTSRREEPISAT